MAERAFQRLRKPERNDRAHFAVKEPERDARISDLQSRVEQRSVEAALRAPDAGDPLAPALRLDLEQKFGRDLSGIRVHSTPETQKATVSANALALTRGAHIYIAAPAVARHPRVMAHEVAHSIEHGAAPPVRLAAQKARGAHGAARRAPPGRAAASAGRAPPAQRWDIDVWGAARSVGNSVSSGIDSAVGAVADFGSDLIDAGRDAVMGAIRNHLPEFLPLFEGDGIASFLRRLIENGLKSLFDGLTAPLRGIIDVDALGQNFRAAIDSASRIAGQLANNDCSGVLEAARNVGQIFNDTLSPVFAQVREKSSQVEGFFRGLTTSITAPIMDLLRNIGGEIWESLQGFVGDLASLIRRAREALGGAWDRVKGWLGIRAEDGESEGGGLWNWVREKAVSIGSSISDRIRPVLGPMRQVAGTMLLIIPGGQILGIIALWPQIRQSYDQISQYWTDLNLIPRAREYLANTVFPQLMSNAEAFGQALIAGADWLLGKFDEFNGFLTEVADAAVGILSPLRALISAARTISHGLITWAREKLQALSRNLHSLLLKFVEFMRKVGDALKDLIAAAVNPFGIIGLLAGTIWLALPECLKGPIIDFVLDLLDTFISAIPNNPALGILWPVVKSALLGFVRRVKSVQLAEKIALADKIAKIISGQSFDFAVGFLRGIVLGIWEAIIAPFQALAMIFELPDRIQRFLENLGVSLCEIVEQIRCFLATLAGSVFGRLDSLLGTLQEYLSDPAKILDLIDCAIEGLLSAAESLGARLADGMLGIFRETEDQIGERLGRFTGGIIVQAVIAYFTAGISAGVGIAGRVAEMLGAVGRALGEVLQFITQQLGRLINFIKGFIARIGRAIVSGARSILGRMKGFFKRVFGWLGRLFRRLFNAVRRRFMMSPAQLARWEEFKLLLAESMLAHHSGITRRELRVIFRSHLNRFRDVARWPAFITKHGPDWRMHARHVKGILPHTVAHVPLDPATRLRAATREARREIRGAKRIHPHFGTADIQIILERLQLRYNMTSFTVRYSPTTQAFEVHGAINPANNWVTRPPRPPHNVVESDTPHRAITVNPLSKLQVYSPPTAAPWSPWNQVGDIRALPSGTSSQYVRGHIAHGRFVNGHASNLMPISRAANANMRAQVEGPVILSLLRPQSTRPVFRYQVITGNPTPGALITRRLPRPGGGTMCSTVPAEATLVSSISMTATPMTYNPSSGDWNVPHGTPISTSSPIHNVGPGYIPGHGEPCP